MPDDGPITTTAEAGGVFCICRTPPASSFVVTSAPPVRNPGGRSNRNVVVFGFALLL
jgi:hypothetical protein